MPVLPMDDTTVSLRTAALESRTQRFPTVTHRFQKLMSNTVATQSCGQNLVVIRAALNRYRAEHAGKYPPALAALTSKYLPDRSATTCGSEGFQTEYTPPKPNAPADAPIVSFSGSEATIMSVRQMSMSQRIYVRLLKDGRIVVDQVQRTEQSQEGGRAPSAGGSAGQ